MCFYFLTHTADDSFVLVCALTGGGVVGLWRTRGAIQARVAAAEARIL